jgi:hypothetical protein
MTTRKSQLDAARQKGIRLTVTIIGLAVLAIYLYVIIRRW